MTWEYIAGFFDGEGTVARNSNGYRIAITQTNKEVLEAIKLFSGVGGIFVPKKRQPHWKDSWIFFAAGQKEVRLFLRGVLPFLVVKKALVERALPEVERRIKLQRARQLNHKKRFNQALRLRGKGLSYWRIGREMGLDRGYVRRLILRGQGVRIA